MKTSTSTTLDAKGLIRTVTEYQLTRAEKTALRAIASCACHWERKRPYVEIRSFDDKLDESKTVRAKDCHALNAAGLLESDPMAYHGYQFNITPLGFQMVDKLNGKGV